MSWFYPLQKLFGYEVGPEDKLAIEETQEKTLKAEEELFKRQKRTEDKQYIPLRERISLKLAERENKQARDAFVKEQKRIMKGNMSMKDVDILISQQKDSDVREYQEKAIAEKRFQDAMFRVGLGPTGQSADSTIDLRMPRIKSIQKQEGITPNKLQALVVKEIDRFNQNQRVPTKSAHFKGAIPDPKRIMGDKYDPDKDYNWENTRGFVTILDETAEAKEKKLILHGSYSRPKRGVVKDSEFNEIDEEYDIPERIEWREPVTRDNKMTIAHEQLHRFIHQHPAGKPFRNLQGNHELFVRAYTHLLDGGKLSDFELAMELESASGNYKNTDLKRFIKKMPEYVDAFERAVLGGVDYGEQYMWEDPGLTKIIVTPSGYQTPTEKQMESLFFAPKKYSAEEIYGKTVLRNDYDPLTKTKEEIEYEKRYNKNLELSNKLYQKEIEMEKLMGGRYPNPLYPSTIGHKNKKISDILDHYALGSMMSSASQGYIPSSRDLGMGEKNVFVAPAKETGLGAYTRHQEESAIDYWSGKNESSEKIKQDLTDINVPWGVYYGHAKRDKGLGEGIFSGVEYRDLAVQTSKFIKNEEPLIEYYRNNKGWSDEKIRDVVLKHELIHRAMTTSGFFPSSIEAGSYLKENFEGIGWDDPHISNDMQEAMTRAYTNKISNNGKLDLKQLDFELASVFENVKTRKLIINKYLPLFDKAFDNYLSEVGTGISSSELNQRKSKDITELADRKSQIRWIKQRFKESKNEMNRLLPKNEIEKIKINPAIKNNNPFNLNYTTIDWDGKLERDVSIEPRFERFESPLMGMRAGIINTLTHHLNYGDDTIEKLITRHAPPTENDTEGFINFVAKETNRKPNEKIDLTKEYMLYEYAKAVTLYEGFDSYYEPLLINDAIDMAYKQKGIK